MDVSESPWSRSNNNRRYLRRSNHSNGYGLPSGSFRSNNLKSMSKKSNESNVYRLTSPLPVPTLQSRSECRKEGRGMTPGVCVPVTPLD